MDDRGTLTMSGKELNRLEVLGRVLERRLTQTQAAEQLGRPHDPQIFRPCYQGGTQEPRDLLQERVGLHPGVNRWPPPIGGVPCLC